MKADPRNAPAQDPKHPEYDPPQVERVIDADDLAREVHYAGRSEPISQ
jgi:hypothetical protein